MRKAILTGKGRRWASSGHPWVYTDDIAEVDGEAGDLLPVFDPAERPLGWALYSDLSRISLRFVSRSAEQPDREFWAGRVRRAVDARARLGLLQPEGACRLLAGDSDGLPGFVVDRYANVLVAQSGTQAGDRMRDFLLELLQECLPLQIDAVLDRSDAAVRKLEGLEKRVEWLRGSEPSELVVREPGLEYEVDVLQGHKTGHYLDQRENRAAAAAFAEGVRVLDAFCYDGLFGIRAALAGAEEVVCIDQSATAGERLLRNAERNGVAERVRFVKADAMQELRRMASECGEGAPGYGLVILDPPAFARNRREIEGAERGYREVNLRALRMLDSGGRLVTNSCSYNLSREEFVQVLARASRDAGRELLLDRLAGASPDHPWLVTLPESSYLKCAFARVEG